MFLHTVTISTRYSRQSKTGKRHEYTRTKTVGLFKCDACCSDFTRDLGHMDRRRLNNDYHHVCPNCDSKRFAQKKGVERRKIWSMSVDTDIDITKI